MNNIEMVNEMVKGSQETLDRFLGILLSQIEAGKPAVFMATLVATFKAKLTAERKLQELITDNEYIVLGWGPEPYREMYELCLDAIATCNEILEKQLSKIEKEEV